MLTAEQLFAILRELREWGFDSKDAAKIAQAIVDRLHRDATRELDKVIEEYK